MRKLVAFGAVLTIAAAAAPSTVQASSNTQGEQRLLQVVNQVRAQHGLPKLSVDRKLQRIARLHSRDMASNGFFSHTSPTNGTFEQRTGRAGVRGNIAENLAFTNDFCVYGGEAGTVARMWMNSAGHRRNMLSRSLRHAGIGRATQGGKALYTLVLRG